MTLPIKIGLMLMLYNFYSTAGTTGAVLTCPLEVVKTRLQSSVSSFVQVNVQSALRLLPSQQMVTLSTCTHNCPVAVGSDAVLDNRKFRKSQSQLINCLRHILKTEGVKGLFKGLGPTLVGVAPSRAIYFGAYAHSKQVLNNAITPDTHFVHLCSAVTAGVSAATCTNPVWFVKTRLQLDNKAENKLTCRECIKRIYKQNGIRGFYKGISASYFGVSETVVHLVVYEAIKAHLQNKSNHDRLSETLIVEGVPDETSATGAAPGNAKDSFLTSDYIKYMLAGACSKTCATCLCYPHEVARTRLREEGSRYNSFFQTLFLVFREEGRAGLYRGLGTQLIRQIPNTAIVMATYEAVVHALMPESESTR
ncbi:unnamed protein product [Lymnaea stagnalis]|uniref:Uncharacterized protein n=1 Tax=Lymnaea stagnalis TaxID=6523 RepID=A0AAV2HFY6_LYMST